MKNSRELNVQLHQEWSSCDASGFVMGIASDREHAERVAESRGGYAVMRWQSDWIPVDKSGEPRPLRNGGSWSQLMADIDDLASE